MALHKSITPSKSDDRHLKGLRKRAQRVCTEGVHLDALHLGLLLQSLVCHPRAIPRAFQFR